MAKPPVRNLSRSESRRVNPALVTIARLSESRVCNRPRSQDAFVMSHKSLRPGMKLFQGMPPGKALECASRRFLGLPYLLEALGEGSGVDSDPLFRFDALDCMTYVEESIALSLATSAETFMGILDDIRYRDGEIGFASRNHFVEADWIPGNQKAGFIGDITAFVGGESTRQMFSSVDRVKWIMDRDDLTDDEKNEIIGDFEGDGVSEKQEVTVDYIPITDLLNQDGTLNARIAQRLPEISIVLMLRPEEDAIKAGTIVSHMGLLIAPIQPDGTRSEPIIRYAASRTGIIMDELFADHLYSQRPYREGVMVLEIKGASKN